MPVSEEELVTVALLACALAVGSVLVGWPVDWSAVDLAAQGKLGLASGVGLWVLRASGISGAGGACGAALVGLTVVGAVGEARWRRPGQQDAGAAHDRQTAVLRLAALGLLALVVPAIRRQVRSVLATPVQAAALGRALAGVGAWVVWDAEVRRVVRRVTAPADAADGKVSVEQAVAELEEERLGQWGQWDFTVVEGLFAHDAAEDGLVPAAVMPRLGLLDASPSRWANLAAHVAGLNAQAGPDTSFKLVFVQRHGEGWHNVAETFYGHGSARWCDEYARRYFADGMVWGPDPELTPAGLEQASDVARAWAAEVRDGGAAAVLPKVLWASPLKRAAMTLAISYGDVLLSSSGAPQPVIKENLRERIGVHTCDIRPPSYEIETVYGRARHPTNPLDFVLEPGFTTFDEFWTPDARETDGSMDRRARLILSELFARHIEVNHVALAGHGGIILALFRTVNHKACATPTGAFIPMVIKGVRSPA